MLLLVVTQVHNKVDQSHVLEVLEEPWLTNACRHGGMIHSCKGCTEPFVAEFSTDDKMAKSIWFLCFPYQAPC